MPEGSPKAPVHAGHRWQSRQKQNRRHPPVAYPSGRSLGASPYNTRALPRDVDGRSGAAYSARSALHLCYSIAWQKATRKPRFVSTYRTTAKLISSKGAPNAGNPCASSGQTGGVWMHILCQCAPYILRRASCMQGTQCACALQGHKFGRPTDMKLSVRCPVVQLPMIARFGCMHAHEHTLCRQNPRRHACMHACMPTEETRPAMHTQQGHHACTEHAQRAHS